MMFQDLTLSGIVKLTTVFFVLSLGSFMILSAKEGQLTTLFAVVTLIMWILASILWENVLSLHQEVHKSNSFPMPLPQQPNFPYSSGNNPGPTAANYGYPNGQRF